MKSPFKFLDAYDRQDKEIFFGRAEEIEQLYNLVFQTKLLLVYGQSGTGKSSLIQCGLANRFKPTDWFELFVRRKDNINISLQREIRRHAETPITDAATVSEAIQSLYLDHLRPVYLIFDQFEELFILGSKEEQQTFIRTIAALLKSDVACKIIFAMREEYIAMLYDFEKAVPALFNKRFRVETISLQNVENVITGTAKALNIALEKGEATAQQIIDNLSDHRAGVQLSYLQVYLDKLYREAAKAHNGQSDSDKPIVFSERLVQKTGALGDVMADFLEEQTAVIQKDLKAKFPATPAEAVQLILEEFATLEGTKQPITRAELSAKLEMSDPVIEACLMALENSRILRNIEGVYELAHDTLAGRIADKRSVERKNLLKIQKLIKDRHFAFEQTRTFLNKEELGFIAPHLTKLNLNEEESRFVKRSQLISKRKQKQIIGGTIGLIVVLAGLTVWSLFNASEAKRQRNRAEQAATEADEQRNKAENFAKRLAQFTDLEISDKKISTTAGADNLLETPDTKPPQPFPSHSGDITIGKSFLERLVQWESEIDNSSDNVYRGFAGHLIIGAGHPLTKAELTSGKIRIETEMVDYREGLSKDQIMKLLKQDLQIVESVINDNVKVALTQNQFEALVAFVYHIGSDPFLRSTLLKRLNEGKKDEVPKQLARWVNIGNVKSDLLVMRREKEIALWNGTLR